VQLEPEQGEPWVRVIPEADDELFDVEAIARCPRRGCARSGSDLALRADNREAQNHRVSI
jgi:hypothetical protein